MDKWLDSIIERIANFITKQQYDILKISKNMLIEIYIWICIHMNENTCAFKITFDYFLCVNAKKKCVISRGHKFKSLQEPSKYKYMKSLKYEKIWYTGCVVNRIHVQFFFSNITCQRPSWSRWWSKSMLCLPSLVTTS